MKRLIAIIFACFTLSAGAQNRAETLLRQATEAVKSLGGYKVSFEVETSDYRADGRYAVSGREYYLAVDGMEVFCDGKIRYEVNNELREITLDPVSAEGRNILDNPVDALDFVGEQYRSELLGESGGEALMRLVSTDGGPTIEVAVDTASHMPRKLIYRLPDNTAVEVRLKDIRQSKEPLPRFERSKYDGYSVLDMM